MGQRSSFIKFFLDLFYNPMKSGKFTFKSSGPMGDYVKLFLGNSKLYTTTIFQANLSPRPAKRQAKCYENLLMAPGLDKKLVFGENFLR